MKWKELQKVLNVFHYVRVQRVCFHPPSTVPLDILPPSQHLPSLTTSFPSALPSFIGLLPPCKFRGCYPGSTCMQSFQSYSVWSTPSANRSSVMPHSAYSERWVGHLLQEPLIHNKMDVAFVSRLIPSGPSSVTRLLSVQFARSSVFPVHLKETDFNGISPYFSGL